VLPSRKSAEAVLLCSRFAVFYSSKILLIPATSQERVSSAASDFQSSEWDERSAFAGGGIIRAGKKAFGG
jgi:hypothetical protein